MAETFGYKPALLRGRAELSLVGTMLTKSGRGGWSVDLSRLTEVRYVSMAVTGTISQYLVLGDENGRHRISQNLSIVEKNSARDLEFRACVAWVLQAISDGPEPREVIMGPAGPMLWAMFVIGVATLLAALVLGGLIIGTGALDRRGPEGLIYVLGMLALGGYVAWRYRPRQGQVTLPAATLAQSLRGGAV